MKKQLVVWITLLFSVAVSANAQSRVGAFLAYGSEVENLGIGVNGEFYFNDQITLVPSFIFYMTDDTPAINSTIWEMNLNGQVYFASEQTALIYGFAGLNYTHLKYKFKLTDTTSRDGELGINVGIGADFDIDSAILPFAQVKYVISDFDQLVISGGVRFKLGKN